MILCTVVLVRSVVVGDRQLYLHIGNLCGVSLLGNQDFVLETFWKICLIKILHEESLVSF